ncbi:unnamed protein product [Meloidogyne enterolobii]|uniref:Uncharacterized protein n=1 Tax=Meloidogyne enterolobii TaxID=390850 RepID=A0ACB0XKC6_MELEN
MEKYINILFKILTKGNILGKFHLSFYAFLDKLDYSLNISLLYYLIVEYIATSRDCLKMVPEIIFDFHISANIKLSERAEKVEIEQLNGVKYTNYQITNIFNPKVCFVFAETASDISTFRIRINMKK